MMTIDEMLGELQPQAIFSCATEGVPGFRTIIHQRFGSPLVGAGATFEASIREAFAKTATAIEAERKGGPQNEDPIADGGDPTFWVEMPHLDGLGAAMRRIAAKNEKDAMTAGLRTIPAGTRIDHRRVAATLLESAVR